jgi:hypothetical protein
MVTALKVFLIAWFVTHFEPIRDRLERLYLIKRLEKVIDIVTCFKCLSFWSILIVTWNVYYAIFASLIAYLYDSIAERN